MPPHNRLDDVRAYLHTTSGRASLAHLQTQFPGVTFTHQRGDTERPLTPRQGVELLDDGIICVKTGNGTDPTRGFRLGGPFHATQHDPEHARTFTRAALDALGTLLTALGTPTPSPLTVHADHTGRLHLTHGTLTVVSQAPGETLRVHRAAIETLAPGNHLDPDAVRSAHTVTVAGRFIPARIRPGTTDVVEAQLGQTYLPVARPQTIHAGNLARLATHH